MSPSSSAHLISDVLAFVVDGRVDDGVVSEGKGCGLDEEGHIRERCALGLHRTLELCPHPNQCCHVYLVTVTEVWDVLEEVKDYHIGCEGCEGGEGGLGGSPNPKNNQINKGK